MINVISLSLTGKCTNNYSDKNKNFTRFYQKYCINQNSSYLKIPINLKNSDSDFNQKFFQYTYNVSYYVKMVKSPSDLGKDTYTYIYMYTYPSCKL